MPGFNGWSGRTMLLGMVIVATAGTPALAQVTFVPDTSRIIRATGRASMSTAPDLASVTLGAWVSDADARRAKASVDSIIGKIVGLAKGLKVADSDLRTAAVNIEPRFDPDNPRLRGYDVTRSVTVVLRQLDSLDAFLDGAVQAGANRDFNVELSSSRADELRREVIARALTDARNQANLAADQLGVNVVSVRSIDLEATSRLITVSASMASSDASQPSAKFLPGLIRINAEIPVVFVIDDRR